MKSGGIIMDELILKGKKAKEASYILGALSTREKNRCLKKMADALERRSDYILEENKADTELLQKDPSKQKLADRLLLTPDRIAAMADGIRKVADLPDPVGISDYAYTTETGLEIMKISVPLGVIGIIYEARPNVTADAAALALKSGNAVILRGGKDAIHSNIAITNVMCAALKEAGLPDGSINLIEDTSRESAERLMKLNDYLDVIIPRGGAGLIRSVVENATVPAIQTGTGNCHVFVDESADFEMAKNIIINAKTSRPSVCNAEEKLLIHSAVCEDFLKIIIPALKEKNVKILGDEKVCALYPEIEKATEEEWDEEFLDLKIAIKAVDGIDAAINHINAHGTKHSEAIITKSYENSEKFFKLIDAAAVYTNASTRFTDGGEFGFGAEIGISTQKLHARGPMGLKELTSYKYIIRGNGQIR